MIQITFIIVNGTSWKKNRRKKKGGWVKFKKTEQFHQYARQQKFIFYFNDHKLSAETIYRL